MKTRSQAKKEVAVPGKRGATRSPSALPKKRTAFGDITNALRNVRISRDKTSAEQPSTLSTSTEQPSIVKEEEELYVTAEEDNNSDEFLTDYDRSLADQPIHLPSFAQDIFNYYRAQEVNFRVGHYMTRQQHITPHMRTILVDWMVEAQENFEFNHETLYQAVKLTDLYLDKVQTSRKELQLIGTTALFICSKFDERLPPTVDDFLYVCDYAYKREELLEKERMMLTVVNFKIGFPLSYRFLRRLAKITGTNMVTLTLARYILENSLLYCEFSVYLESELAAASLLLAVKLHGIEWTSDHEKYGGYDEKHLLPLMWKLNGLIDAPLPGISVNHIKLKYMNSAFFEVAKVKPLKNPEANATTFK
ncbi:cyclin domain protein [Trichuris suis]|nr:hypothetical protein M513_09761 [Trichuris suis]KHJ40852.1 cyclin domain protein [Trichuris suis]